MLIDPIYAQLMGNRIFVVSSHLIPSISEFYSYWIDPVIVDSEAFPIVLSHCYYPKMVLLKGKMIINYNYKPDFEVAYFHKTHINHLKATKVLDIS